MDSSFDACSNCGAMLSPGQQACPQCGARVGQGASGPAAGSGGSAVDCPTCRKRVESPGGFCPHCGNRLSGPGSSELELAGPARPEGETCPGCGATVPLDQPRCNCGQNMLVDLVADGPAKDAATAYAVAKAFSALGPPAPSFAELKALLAQPKPTLVCGCSRSFAKRALPLLTSHGLACRAQPVIDRPTPAVVEPAKSGRSPVLAILLLLVLAGGAGAYLYKTGRLDAYLGRQKPVPAAAPTQNIAALALPSTAAVRCAKSVGAGFFITEDLLVTNAHVVCPAGEPMRIKMQDGRDLLGQAKKMDDWLDVALVHVLGAAAKPLPLADAGKVVVGEKVAFIGAPQGFDFTVHEATVSFVGRNQLGVGYLQFDGTVNPGNSGGPLVNGEGRVVGVVSLKVLGGESMGLALPANYLVQGDRAIRPELATGLASPEWTALLEKVSQADEEELRKVASAFAKPGLIFARAVQGRGAVAVLLKRAQATPGPMDVSFKLRKGLNDVCQDVRTVSGWETLDGVQNGDATSARWVRWLRQHKLSKNFYVGVAVMESRCFGENLTGTSLVLEDADESASSIDLR